MEQYIVIIIIHSPFASYLAQGADGPAMSQALLQEDGREVWLMKEEADRLRSFEPLISMTRRRR